ncbi:MAG: GNAT family N-acetyltransferase [Bacillota bacterium]
MSPRSVRQEAVELLTGRLILRGMIHRPTAAGRYPAVVLYHGFTGQKTEKNFLFVRFSRALSALGFVCVRFDFSGSGESDGDFAEMTFSGEVAEAKQILDYTLGLPFVDPARVCLVGLSMGGAIASIVAGDEPSKVRALVLWAPAGNMPQLMKALETPERLADLEKHGRIDIGGLWLGRSFLTDLAGWDIYGRAGGFPGPVLIIHGDADAVVPITASYRYKEIYGPRATLHVIPGGDHTFNRADWAEEVMSFTRNFLLAQVSFPGDKIVGETKRKESSATTAALPFSIRPATLGDLPTIEEIYNEAGIATTASFDLAPRSAEKARAWFGAHGPAHPIFVAELDGRVIGWASLSPYSPKAAYRYTVEDSVYVHRDFHRQGVGSALLAAVVKAAAELGYRAVVAKIVAGNEASLALHRKAGFVSVGRLVGVGYKFDRWLDVDLLELLLPEGSKSFPQDKL